MKLFYTIIILLYAILVAKQEQFDVVSVGVVCLSFVLVVIEAVKLGADAE